MSREAVTLAALGGAAFAGLLFVAAFEANDDASARSDLPADEWCVARVWDEGLAPVDWTKAQLVEDCTDALEGGWTRPILVDLYEQMKADGA